MNDTATYPIEINKEEFRILIKALRDDLQTSISITAFADTYKFVQKARRIDNLRANYDRLP